MSRFRALALLALLASTLPAAVSARTLYVCQRDDRLSYATAPEPGSRCKAKQVSAGRSRHPGFWGSLGPVRGNVYQRVMGGRVVYSTRPMAGWTEVRSVVALKPPPDSSVHLGLGQVGKPRLDVFASQFRDAARRTGAIRR